MFAALHIPDLAVVAALRANPEVQGLPCAVLNGASEALVEKVKLPLLALNARARGTGVANLFVNVKTFRALKLVIVSEPFLLADGRIQISEGGQPTVYVTSVVPLPRNRTGTGGGIT